MATRYRIAHAGNDDWGKPGRLWTILARIVKWGHGQRGPFRLRERKGNEEFGPERSIKNTVRRLSTLLPNGRTGDFWAIRSKNEKILLIRKVQIKLKSSSGGGPVQDHGGTPPINRIFSEVVNKFNVESWGICNCRRIAGSSSWSQHSWCNAWDIHASVATMDQVAHWLNENKARLGIANVLWRVPSHYDHVHVDALPTRTGTPPCAS